MNRLILKIAASVLTAGAIILFAAGCLPDGLSVSHGLTQGELTAILKSSRFGATTLSLPDSDAASGYSYQNKRFIGITGDKLVFYTNSARRTNGEENYEIIDELFVYDTDGNQTSHIYLKDIFRNICDGSHVLIENVAKEGGSYSVIASVSDNEYNLVGRYKVIFDAQRGTVSQIQSYRNIFPEQLGDSIPCSICEIEGYRICTYAVWNGHIKYCLTVTDPDGYSSVIDIEETLQQQGAEGTGEVCAVIGKGGANALVCIGNGPERSYAELDLASASLIPAAEDYSWAGGFITNAVSIDGLGTYIADSEGICSIDFANRELIRVFDYANTDADGLAAEGLIPVNMDEDRIILAGCNEDSRIVVFDRAY